MYNLKKCNFGLSDKHNFISLKIAIKIKFTNLQLNPCQLISSQKNAIMINLI